VRNVGSASSGATGTAMAVTVPTGGIPAGHTLIVTATLDPQAGTVSCSDSKGNTYRTDVDVARGSGTDGVRTVVCSAAIRTALVAGNTVVMSHPSVMARAMNVAEFSGYLTPTLATYKENCGNGIVDAGEQCDGGTCCTATCTFVASGTVCRTGGGVCDVAEACTGASATCPADAKRAAGTVCRAAAGPCDVAE